MASQTNSTLPSVVRSIEGRVEQLIADHQRLSRLSHDLLIERDQLQEAKREMQSRIAALEKELAMTQLQNGLNTGSSSNKRATAYINRLMREVDNCITLLSSPGAE